MSEIPECRTRSRSSSIVGDSGLTLAAVAESVGATAPALCAAFFQQTGQHFSDYLRNTRLDAAARMLLESSTAIKEILYAIGYEHRASFNHEFRERFGMSPSHFRASRTPLLPLASCHSQPAHEDHCSQPALLTGRRVLIVDDDEGSCDGVARRFRLAGWRTDTATSLRSGLDCARSTWPDAVVVDFHLPDGDGLEFLRELRTTASDRHAAAAIFSADWEAEDRREEAHALGAAILSKLADPDDLPRVISSLLEVRGND